MVKLSLKKLDGTPVEKWVKAPRYGGTFIVGQDTPNLSWDDLVVGTNRSKGAAIVTNELLQGDWTRGPAGTEETTWWGKLWTLEFEAGALAESWEIPDAETIIYHVRHGVYFHNKPPVNGRELDAEDVAAEFNYKMFTKGGRIAKRVGKGNWFISATAVDKWTVVVKGKEQQTGVNQAFQQLSDQNYIYPRELAQQGVREDWQKSVGTGPFIVVDNLENSSTTFVRNPNYWKYDPLHPENQLPYVDTVKMLIIQDASTRYAALRVGKIDYIGQEEPVPWEDAEVLLQSNPELGFAKQVWDKSDGALGFRCDRAPFNDIRVRRAMAMGIDRQAIQRDYYGGKAVLFSYPSLDDISYFKGVFVPLDQLPESSRELWEYHPDKAKQLLAEAGYPNGFKFSAVLYSDLADMAQIYKADLAKVGVNMELDVKEYSVFISLTATWPQKHKDSCFDEVSTTGIAIGTNLFPGSAGNKPIVNDPFVNEIRFKLNSFELMQNQAERTRLEKELSLYIMSQAWAIEPPAPYIYHLWTPWVKNLYGPNGGLTNRDGSFFYVWIDQGLKAKMGR